MLVFGADGEAVGRTVRALRSGGVLAVGYVGGDEQAARQMAEEMIGGVDEVVRAEGG